MSYERPESRFGLLLRNYIDNARWFSLAVTDYYADGDVLWPKKEEDDMKESFRELDEYIFNYIGTFGPGV